MAGSIIDVFTVLIKGAQERLHVPDKWTVEAPNKNLISGMLSLTGFKETQDRSLEVECK